MSARSAVVKEYLENGWVPFLYQGMTSPGPGWQMSEPDEALPARAATTDNPVALLLGKESGLVVVDVDTQNGGDIYNLFDRYGEDTMKNTRVVATPSGGWHLYFQYPKHLDKLTKVINAGRKIEGLDGIDLLSDGAHVVAPPTARVGIPGKTDGAYKVVNEVPVAELPDALLEDWLTCSERPYLEGVPTGVINPEDYEWAVSAHRQNIKTTENAVPGERDTTAYRKICSSVRIAKAVPDEILSLVQVEQDFANVSYGIKDLRGKMNRAVAYADEHPWEDLSPLELVQELPESIRQEDAWQYFRKLADYRIADAAKEVVSKERIERAAAQVVVTEPYRGDEFMTMDLEVPEWIIEGLAHYNGKALLAAQYKAGKSTTMLEVIRALTTGTPFFGHFHVPRPMRVGFFDMELGQGMAQRWLADTDANYSNLLYKSMLGKGKELDMRSDMLRQKTARQLREFGTEILIIDPLSPVISALGLDENHADSIRPMLDSFDELAQEAGLAGLIVTHHTGHEATGRARGSTAFMDWASALWLIQKDKEDNSSPRTFEASGRDVFVPKKSLHFNPATRGLTIIGGIEDGIF